MEVIKKIDNGIINFGNYNGEKWSKISESYLNFLISNDCHTSGKNKKIAKQELSNRMDLDNQGLLF